MEEELKDRFKALHSIQSVSKKCDEEENEAVRILEKEFELKYKDIYAQREALINGKGDPN